MKYNKKKGEEEKEMGVEDALGPGLAVEKTAEDPNIIIGICPNHAVPRHVSVLERPELTKSLSQHNIYMDL
ncbi:hypothetical protein RJT34_26484 [Clitoria ternatea]|uniref:Uncharacterized protein n=1 Tax=Clitoria ternatea TaxID=43366 RepID=A0AAN9F6W9_CLITE